MRYQRLNTDDDCDYNNVQNYSDKNELDETNMSSENNREHQVDLDSVLVEIGEFGRFQIFTYILICFPVFFSAANSLTYVFTAGVPPYRCYVEGCDNGTNSEYSQVWLPFAIPQATGESNGYVPAHCDMYQRLHNYTVNTCTASDFSQDEITQCNSWVFDPKESTIVNEWEITCDENQWKLSLVGTLHFAGILIGSLIFGYFADSFGRKIMLIIALVMMSITGVIQAAAPNYIVFQAFVLLNAIATAGVYPLAFILGVELVGPSKREISSIIINYFYAVGEAFVGVVAWSSGNWKVIQLAVSVPPFFFFVYYWFVPESVRWLLSQNKFVKARQILTKAARINETSLSAYSLNCLTKGESMEKVEVPQQSFIKSLMELGRSRRLLFRSFNLFFIWATNAFVYYGLSINSTSLGGNKYINFIAVCLAEIPGYTLAWYLLHKGRRPSLCGSMILCAVTCLGAAFVPTDIDWAVLLLFLVGKIGITSSFAIIYVYSAELYPTQMRSACVGVCSTMGRFGAMVAPFVPLLGQYAEPLPLLLFGIVSLIAGFLGLLLPETAGIHLPDSVKDAEKI